MTLELRLGRWQDVLKDVEQVDALICDPPYSERTDRGYRSATDFKPVALDPRKAGQPGARRTMPKTRFELNYAPLERHHVSEIVEAFKPNQWWVVFGDHVSCRWWESDLNEAGYLVFAPVVWVRTDSAPRFFADGPANSCEWIIIARPRTLPDDRFSRPGYYAGSIHADKVVTGGKPLWLMRALVRDYSRPGDLIVDPCAGGATTLLAAAMEGRRAIGAEMDPETYAKAQKRLAGGWTPPLFTEPDPVLEQADLFGEAHP